MHFACADPSTADPAVWILNHYNYHGFIQEKLNVYVSEFESLTVSNMVNAMLSGQQGFDYPTVYKPYYVDQRMSAQSSYFMVWGNKKNPLEELIPEQNRMLQTNLDKSGIRFYGPLKEKGILLKLIIDHSQKPEILHQLDILGINEKTLFPRLDGIGKYVERKYRFDYVEAINNF